MEFEEKGVIRKVIYEVCCAFCLKVVNYLLEILECVIN
jgi:hypothetical protein